MGEVKDIPKGWERVALNDIAEINPSLNKSQLADDMLFPFVPMPSVGAGDGRINITTERLFSEVKKGYTPFQSGDVLFAKITPCMENGKIAVVPHLKDQYGFGSTEFHVIRPLAGTDSHYIFYFVSRQEFRNIAASKMTGAVGQKRVPTDFIKQALIPLPPLPEQHRIVARIEELFSDLDKGIESLKTAQQQLKVYRQAVLKWAFEGKLTNKDVKEGELPQGWTWKRIDEVTSVGTGATPLKSNKSYYENGTIAWVTSGALNDDFVRSASGFVTDKAIKETNLTVYPKHTLLLAMYGEGKTRGKCSELLIEACTNQAIAAIYFERHDVRIKSYLKYFLLKNYNEVRKLAAGGVQPNLNLGIVKSTLFPTPPTIQEQQDIVAEIEDRLSVCDKMEESISQSLQQAEALRQSILKKAFEGKLVPQDPNDESAGVLLERIRPEKAEIKSEKKGRKGKGKA